MSSDQLGPKKRGGVRKKANGKQKRARRSDFEFPALEPSVALHSRRSEVEDVASYAHKLNHEEKAWLNQFMKEYNEASVGSEEEPTGVLHTPDEILKDKDGEVIMTTNRWGMVDKNSVPMTSKKLCTDRNNDRNRCEYTLAVSANRLNLVEHDYEMERLMYGFDPDLEPENDVEDDYFPD